MDTKHSVVTKVVPDEGYLEWEHENMKYLSRFEIVGPYTLHLVFSNGVEKTIDFHDYVFHESMKAAWGGQLQELDYFNQAYVDDSGVLTWPNRYAINPAMLYTWAYDSWREWVG